MQSDRVSGRTGPTDQGVVERCRFFRVSNFSVRNLETLLAEAKVVPAVNQVRCSTYTGLIDRCSVVSLYRLKHTHICLSRDLTSSVEKRGST